MESGQNGRKRKKVRSKNNLGKYIVGSINQCWSDSEHFDMTATNGPTQPRGETFEQVPPFIRHPIIGNRLKHFWQFETKFKIKPVSMTWEQQMVWFRLYCIVVGCFKMVWLGPYFSVCFWLDTHQYLKENQIFTCIKPTSGGRRYLSSWVLISHSPTIHPSDVRIVEAIGGLPLFTQMVETATLYSGQLYQNGPTWTLFYFMFLVGLPPFTQTVETATLYILPDWFRQIHCILVGCIKMVRLGCHYIYWLICCVFFLYRLMSHDHMGFCI